jgi:hypothetical protein
MTTLSKAQILKTTHCQFYINVASAPLLVHVSKKDLRMALKNTQRTHFSCDLSEYIGHAGCSHERKYYTLIILL